MKTLRSLLLLTILLSACASGRGSQLSTSRRSTVFQAPRPSPTAVAASPTSVPTATSAPTSTPTATEVPPTPTPIPSATPLPTHTSTPTEPPTPTSAFPVAAVQMQANCRYGPGEAYLYSHGLYEGDRAEVHGRSGSGNWLWIQPSNLDRHCWVSADVVEVTGDVMALDVVTSRLPASTLYGPPQNVSAERDGKHVFVYWDRVPMTQDDDRGYLLVATVCKSGRLVTQTVHTDDNQYKFRDDPDCSAASTALLYTVEKHGYTAPVQVPWPDQQAAAVSADSPPTR